MQPTRILDTDRAAIVDRWTDLALVAYPRESAGFLRGERDRFRNPVGQVTRESLQALLDGLVDGRPPTELREPLDAVLRIRAVQDMPPSRAVGFVLGLKRILREAPADGAPGADLPSLDDRVDRLALEAFDVYASCREKIYELRLDEIRRRSSTLFRRAESACDVKGGCGA